MATVESSNIIESVDHVKVFKALADETRLKIIDLLSRKGELCVCFIYDELKMSQPRISRHLGILKDCGVLTSRPEGSWVYYSLNCEKLDEVTDGFGIMVDRCLKKKASLHCD